MHVMAIGGSVVQDGPLRNVNLGSETAANTSSEERATLHNMELNCSDIETPASQSCGHRTKHKTHDKGALSLQGLI